jgi:ABC-type transport system involved in cytochrome bd biosynthesis fused ATPase/permease subunit
MLIMLLCRFIAKILSITAKTGNQKYLCDFFQACRGPIIKTADAAGFQRHKSHISKIVSEDTRLEAYILPTSISRWPSFRATKQYKAACCEIYFKRVADSNGPRFDETVRLLKGREKVVSVGLSGIGKSTEVNGLLMQFLFHIGKPGWPGEVWYRCNDEMLKFSLSGS